MAGELTSKKRIMGLTDDEFYWMIQTLEDQIELLDDPVLEQLVYFYRSYRSRKASSLTLTYDQYCEIVGTLDYNSKLNPCQTPFGLTYEEFCEFMEAYESKNQTKSSFETVNSNINLKNK